MRTWSLTVLFLGLLLFSVVDSQGQSVSIETPQDPTDPAIEIYIALVTSDLQIRPVPKHRLILAGIDTDTFYAITVSFEGRTTVHAAPGHYRLSSVEPVSFEGKQYAWELAITLQEGGLQLELSNHNATIERLLEGSTVPVTDEAEIFQNARDAVVTVVAEAGKGSGFLVNESGLIVTNYHVAGGSDYLAVKLDELRKYPALLIAEDARSDIGVLLVHPKVVEGIEPLKLADSSPEESPVVVGERVLAIGSPLSSEGILTTGIVSKVSAGVILSDVNINPGNSGGPLLNMLGEVIGINTFGEEGGSGPGVSGIVRIHEAYTAIEDALARVANVTLPSYERLPEASRHPFPPDALARMANPDLRLSDYHVEAGKVDVQFYTPVVVASLETSTEAHAREQQEIRSRKSRRRNKQKDKETKPAADESSATANAKDGFYEWRQYAGDYRPIVRINAIPEIKMTGGSLFAKAMLGASAAGRYRFKVDFQKMRLLRGGVEVAPIYPRKIKQVFAQRSGVDVLEDIQTYGAYEYPPEAFEPSQPLILEVYTEQRPDKPKVREIDSELQGRIWAHFAPYFASLLGEGARED